MYGSTRLLLNLLISSSCPHVLQDSLCDLLVFVFPSGLVIISTNWCLKSFLDSEWTVLAWWLLPVLIVTHISFMGEIPNHPVDLIMIKQRWHRLDAACTHFCWTSLLSSKRFCWEQKMENNIILTHTDLFPCVPLEYWLISWHVIRYLLLHHHIA